ncbi:hypothetical protein T4E_3018 [Trichinella pseudospiralis]|uniref:Uncharacterized protein n=1 Tax=Trichinella pseudospiralis TaxID=6337 RepID=A0A0V0YJD0_TRIPS|nr:hypothetical protein T4E_3018 [Trichinella pseudospiralis]
MFIFYPGQNWAGHRPLAGQKILWLVIRSPAVLGRQKHWRISALALASDGQRGACLFQQSFSLRVRYSTIEHQSIYLGTALKHPQCQLFKRQTGRGQSTQMIGKIDQFAGT